MRYIKIELLIIMALITLLVSCGRIQPITDLQDVPVPDGLTMDQVRKSILIGGAELGWIIKKLNVGILEGQLNLRDHEAIVLIMFDTSKYSIEYSSSKNLGFENGDIPKIHRNYNSWIKNLRRKINRELIRFLVGR